MLLDDFWPDCVALKIHQAGYDITDTVTDTDVDTNTPVDITTCNMINNVG